MTNKVKQRKLQDPMEHLGLMQAYNHESDLIRQGLSGSRLARQANDMLISYKRKQNITLDTRRNKKFDNGYITAMQDIIQYHEDSEDA